MRNFIFILAAVILSGQASASPYPEMNKVSDSASGYMYIYPEIRFPTCSPSRLPRDEWFKQKREMILTENSQNALFYANFKERAKKRNAYVYESGKICHAPSNAGLSRTALNITNLAIIERTVRNDTKGVGKLDGLFINYSHADDYSLLGTPVEELSDSEKLKNAFSTKSKLRFNKWYDADFSDYNTTNSSKRSERVYVLNRLKKMGTKVYVYNRFYNLPDYIKNHDNVVVLSDKANFYEKGWEPNYYTWTNLKGEEINAGFLHIPMRRNQFRSNDGIINLKVNGKIYDYKFNNLSPDSRRLAINLMGGYPYAHGYIKWYDKIDILRDYAHQQKRFRSLNDKKSNPQIL